MTRWLDDIIKVVKNHPRMCAVHKLVHINRLEKEPTKEELDAALIEFQKTTKDAMNDKKRYANRNNGREVVVETERDDMIEVKYLYSGMRAWYKIADFARIFREK